MRRQCRLGAPAFALAAMTHFAGLVPGVLVAQTATVVRGDVRSVANEPLPGVEVTLEATGAVVRTSETGTFRFSNVAAGLHTLSFRRIGLLPAAVDVNAADDAEPVRVTMIAARRALDTVRVVAHLNVLAGIVVDSLYRPVAGALVDIAGTRIAQTVTDSTGWFSFTSVASGPVIVRARKAGFSMDTHSMVLEDWRGLLLRLESIPADAGSVRRMFMSGIGPIVESVWLETRQRLAMQVPRSVLVSREELAPFGSMTLGQVIPLTRSAHRLSIELASVFGRPCVIEDGRTVLGPMSLDMYKASNVDFVELYAPGTTGAFASKDRWGVCADESAGSHPNPRGPFYAVVWIR